jgi:hypothetical protein
MAIFGNHILSDKMYSVRFLPVLPLRQQEPRLVPSRPLLRRTFSFIIDVLSPLA